MQVEEQASGQKVAPVTCDRTVSSSAHISIPENRTN